MTLNQNWEREPGESRTEEYRRWRTRLGFGAVSDVDQIEYLSDDGRPVMAIELCVADRRSPDYEAGVKPGHPPSDGFFAAVEGKVGPGRPQGRLARYLTRALGIPLLLVVYIRGELERGVWVKRVDGEKPWEHLALDEYCRRLKQMHGPKK